MIKDLEKIILTGIPKDMGPVLYARGFGRCLGILEGVVRRMSDSDRDEFFMRLDDHAESWKTVEKSTT